MAEKKNSKQKKGKKAQTSSGKAADVPGIPLPADDEKSAGIKKNPAGSQLRDTITGVILIAFSIFLIIALLTDTTGEIGRILSMILKGLLGLVAYVLPFYLMIYAVLMLVQKVAHVNSRTVLFTLILILDMSMINSVRFDGIRAGSFDLSFLRQSFLQGVDLDSAGVVGMVLGWVTYKLVAVPGLVIIAVVVLIICLLLVANTPISKFFDDLRIKKNQKKIDGLTDRTESGTSDPLKDTMPIPVISVAGEKTETESATNTDSRFSEKKNSRHSGSFEKNVSGGGAAPETNTPQRPSYMGYAVEDTAGVSPAVSAGTGRSRISDFFESFSRKKTDRETISLSDKNQILNYMKDDSLLSDHPEILRDPETSGDTVERGLGASYGDIAQKILNHRRQKEQSDYDPFSEKYSSDGIRVSDPDEDAFLDSMRRGLEEFSGPAATSSPVPEDVIPVSQPTVPSAKPGPDDTGTGTRAAKPGSRTDAGNEAEKNRKEPSGKHEEQLKAARKTTKKNVAASAAESLEEVSKAAESSAVPAEKQYVLPPLSLLNPPERKSHSGDVAELRENAGMLEKILRDFGVEARVINVNRGPSITRYELQPATGVKVNSIVRLSDDIALNLRAKSLRIEAPIPGKAAIGIEVQNDHSDLVSIREMIESRAYREAASKISFAVGEDITGNAVIADLKKMPHMLIAGSTGSGKSVCINSILVSILYRSTPDEVKLILIDPKVVELGNYNGIPHMLIPVVTDPAKAAAALMWAVQEMEARYKKFAKEKVKNLAGFNSKMKKEDRAEEVMPQIVIVIDELADLMIAAAKQVEESICRLAQLARAAGMHMIVATQRPSVDVVTGLIKANVPSRIAFAVSSQVDSRTILDRAGAEKLVGNGDMLFSPLGSSHPQRLQGPFVTDEEVTAVIDFWKEQAGEDRAPEQMQQVMAEINTVTADFGPGSDDNEDDLYQDAVSLVIESGQASASMLQRRFRIGYNRAGRLIDTMEARGIIGPSEGSRPRKVLISREEYEADRGLQEPGEESPEQDGLIMEEDE